jgi:kynurenine formamidase
MMKGRILIIVLLALGVASVAWAQQPVQLKFSRVVDLTLPIESDMPGIPGIKTYADNPSKVDVVTAITEAQKSQLQTEGMTLNSNLAVNGRAMITVLSILVHNGTHIDAPRHMMEKGSPIDQMPLGQLVKEGVLINLPNKGPSSVVTVKDIEESGVELGPNRIPVIHTGFTEKTWGKPEFDVFPEKPLWRGVKLDPGEVWVANHLALFEKGIPLIQFVTNLSQIGTNKFVLIALPLKIKGGDASPARVVALVE